MGGPPGLPVGGFFFGRANLARVARGGLAPLRRATRTACGLGKPPIWVGDTPEKYLDSLRASHTS